MSSNIKTGNITELQVQLALVKLGFLVFTPVNDSSFVDLVIKIDDKYKSVQVKTARKSKTGYLIELRAGRHKQYSS